MTPLKATAGLLLVALLAASAVEAAVTKKPKPPPKPPKRVAKFSRPPAPPPLKIEANTLPNERYEWLFKLRTSTRAAPYLTLTNLNTLALTEQFQDDFRSMIAGVFNVQYQKVIIRDISALIEGPAGSGIETGVQVAVSSEAYFYKDVPLIGTAWESQGRLVTLMQNKPFNYINANFRWFVSKWGIQPDPTGITTTLMPSPPPPPSPADPSP
eukprot:CAMPEP_0202857432 /NCGR_PEP_ID=MMETSP1391-20130828/373_1 /ASSEMBLY_ACC=CAM_ASM_000867 /TAXON_ID=1034604 /ORGANISM="Chlamydomonas leiostraca, Strain SAG 11-49" /LENGTH=211 /DNA_ID=CAMNT_0049536227 /DNA_START=94 /DNA_END=726 /DNA_ORIENTATION=+